MVETESLLFVGKNYKVKNADMPVFTSSDGITVYVKDIMESWVRITSEFQILLGYNSPKGENTAKMVAELQRLYRLEGKVKALGLDLLGQFKN